MKEFEDKEKRKLVIEKLKKFKKMNPWKGDVGERISKFNWLWEELVKIYNKEDWVLICSVPTQTKFWYSSEGSFVDADNKVVVLQGRLSVITFLHEFAHILGANQEEAVKWSNELFKEVFPEKWAKLKRVGDMMVKINEERG